MATFQKRKTKTKGLVWDVVFRIYDGEKSIQKKLSGFPTKREAWRAYEDFLKNYDPTAESNRATRSGVTFSDAYVKYLSAVENNYSCSYISDIKRNFKIHILPCFGTREITGINRADVIRWQETMWNKKTTKGTLYRQATLKGANSEFVSFMKWAADRYSFPNPFDGVTPPRRREARKELHTWSAEQFNIFIDHVTNERHKMFFMLVFYTGCRKDEINALTVDDFIKRDDHYDIKISKSVTEVIGQGKVITPPKTSSGNRVVSVPPFMTPALDEFLKEKEGFLWNLTPSTWNSFFHKAIKAAGLPHIRIHDLRHSHASILIASGVPVTSVSKRLGHASPSTTLGTYTHPIDESEKNVLALLDKIWSVISGNFE
ncbi:MAG: site-specific integrase [Bacteroidales bacterium]|nr:site-specific integrase [Bacteroidales bacterium]